jgi:hypothetical protein
MPLKPAVIAAPVVISVALATSLAAAQAQNRPNVQKYADGVLGLMSYTVAPDVTTSSLALDNAATAKVDLTLTQIGGGFTWSKSLPLYLEGNAAYSRYDPIFLVSDGAAQRPVPVKWNSVSATGGIGWDFRLSEEWVIRPIFNFTYGEVASDLKIAKWWVDDRTNADLSRLDGGTFRAHGLGGALMLDYEKFSPAADDDLEIRYTNVQLHNHGNRAVTVDAHARAESLSIWARRRVPTGWGMVWDRPVRYVYEAAYTRFFGSETDAGLTQMSSLGLGLELDSSALDLWVTRARGVVRYKFGPGLSGWSVGLALSF